MKRSFNALKHIAIDQTTELMCQGDLRQNVIDMGGLDLDLLRRVEKAIDEVVLCNLMSLDCLCDSLVSPCE
jgi:hypothetical protein